MKFYLALVLAASSILVHAKGPPSHMIYVSPRGFGSYLSYERFDPDSGSQFKEFNIFKGNFALNYAYSILPRLQLGGCLSQFSDKRNYKLNNGQDGWVKYDVIHLGIFGILNFSDDLFNAWYTGVAVSYFNKEDEFSKEGTFTFLEDDRISYISTLLFGKRFDLKKLHINNVSFSPQIGLSYAHSGKDYNDDGLIRSLELNLELIRFDILF